MIMRPRLSIRSTLLVIALIGGILTVIRWNDPAVRYRRNHDEASLNAVMSQRVADGNTVETIERMLGVSKQVTDPNFRRSVAAFVARAPSQYPQGLKSGDEFRGYASGGRNTTVFQFPGGRLINFRPSDFAGPSASFSETNR